MVNGVITTSNTPTPRLNAYLSPAFPQTPPALVPKLLEIALGPSQSGAPTRAKLS